MDKTLLIEVGTEELPPTSVSVLSLSFGESISSQLTSLGFTLGQIRTYGSPRRLAVTIDQVSSSQPDREVTRKGPPLTTAFDPSGNPTKAAEGFAKSCGAEIDALIRIKTGGEEWLAYTSKVEKQTIFDLIAKVVENSLLNLPLSRRMRWGDSEVEFIRPLKWVTIIYGQKEAKGTVLGVDVGRNTYGHRFMGTNPILLNSAGEYCEKLLANYVVADFEDRKEMIVKQIEKIATDLNATPIMEQNLLTEVCALVEWPNAILGTFDRKFLHLPEEVVISSMQDHQKYFPLRDSDNGLSNAFITVANVETEDRELIRGGNERVIRPRLEDAEFFYAQDKKISLSARYEKLSEIVFERRLGNLHQKSERIKRIALLVSDRFGAKENLCSLAAKMSRCDLTTDMVTEFPHLQGIMGAAYAALEPKLAPISDIIKYFYHPRFANDKLPPNPESQCIAFTDKLDTLVGIFGVGLKPTGDKDPFGLRRSAIGLIRILVENAVGINLQKAIKYSFEEYSHVQLASDTEWVVYQFIEDRMRGYFTDRGASMSACNAAISSESRSPSDIALRIKALESFQNLAEAKDLVAANKRIANILKKNSAAITSTEIREELLQESSEISLDLHYKDVSITAQRLYESREYERYLIEIASFRTITDDFFDNVKVICDDKIITSNRLSLLNRLHLLFSRVGDLSLLNYAEK